MSRWEESRRRKLPPWTKIQIPQWGSELIIMCEWEMDECIDSADERWQDRNSKHNVINDDDDEVDEYRRTNGWMGYDLCHSRHSSVRISHYAISYGRPSSSTVLQGGVGTTITGLCHFTHTAESHKGYCHGGSMTAVMDDVIGWTAFCVTGQCIPWSGYTVQVNVTLKHPVQIGSYLILRGTIVKWDGGRKVWVKTILFSNSSTSSTSSSSSDERKEVKNNENNYDDKKEEEEEKKEKDDEEIVYCTAEGLVLLNTDINFV